MILKILYDNDTITEFDIKTVWMCHKHGMDKLYFETHYDEMGKGTFIPISKIKTWQVMDLRVIT